jgi:hypothetical protein
MVLSVLSTTDGTAPEARVARIGTVPSRGWWG